MEIVDAFLTDANQCGRGLFRFLEFGDNPSKQTTQPKSPAAMPPLILPQNCDFRFQVIA